MIRALSLSLHPRESATERMTERGDGPWIGDLVHDPIADRRATLSDVSSAGIYTLRAPGGKEWPAEEPERLEIITLRQDRTDWPFPAFPGLQRH